ncbi:hypothetical protein C5167_030168 [Papaver somniferum]|uniref:uncharacterized protein LOC113329607 n=1 Tax=Papaver somniferum TaxID=3469 RepID=UPI000E705D86|nr:uncharacterized protein LOC113329607 [Papaver somniferum]RZC86812.1 hypothetical protein C5167_030168 [Papaver somniferum]
MAAPYAPHCFTIGGTNYYNPVNHEMITGYDVQGDEEDMHLCATCLYARNLATERSLSSWESEIEPYPPIHLPGYLAWLDFDADVLDVHPRIITRIVTSMTQMWNTHLEAHRGALSMFGERISFEIMSDEVIVLPIFCNFCNDNVGFQRFAPDPWGQLQPYEQPLLDMSTVVKYQAH